MLLALLACAPPTSKPESPDVPEPELSLVVDEGLTESAEAALARMPTWLAPDLRLAFAQQKTSRQDELAAVVLGVEDVEILDEVGFALAHLSPEVLKSDNFYPQLVVENAELVYEADALLDYVEIVEEGVAGVDADWRTTTRYQVEVDGAVTTYDLDSELYYWFIVHPRIEDENPWYVDAWEECTRSTLECAADPETGHFWRRFLWDAATATCPEGEACPVVTEYLPGADVLWGAADSDDAVHRVAGMMLDSPDGARWLNFGAYGERSIQPNRIYALGRGNCGEWADMTTAIARTALIPNVNVTPSSWDHTWSAFYTEDRWVAWEPVNWWFDHPYSSGYATWAARGDASVWYQTEQYTENTATLEIVVRDSDDQLVDGATVVLWSPWEDSWWYAGELVTDVDGVARFTVGADQAFAWVVSSDLAGETIDGTIDGIAAGFTDTVRARIDGVMPVAPTPDELGALGELAVDVAIAAEGRLIGTSYRLEDRSTQPVAAPELQVWRMSWEDYAAFEAGESFGVADALDGSGVVVIANLGRAGTAAVGNATITAGEATRTQPFALLPGAWIAVGVGED